MIERATITQTQNRILQCPRRSTHPWSLCPFAHVNERLRRRPLYREDRPGPLYRADLCPAVRAHQECPMGNDCGFAHHVFEHWLHPSMYRTRLCTSGAACSRAMCFFAHSRDELRVAAPPSPPPLPPLLAPPSEGSSRGHSSENLALLAASSSVDVGVAAAAAAGGALAGGGGAAAVPAPSDWESALNALGLALVGPPLLPGGVAAPALELLPAAPMQVAPLQPAVLQTAPAQVVQLPAAMLPAAPSPLAGQQLMALHGSHEAAPAQPLLLAGSFAGLATAGHPSGAAPAPGVFSPLLLATPQPALHGGALLLAAPQQQQLLAPVLATEGAHTNPTCCSGPRA